MLPNRVRGTRDFFSKGMRLRELLRQRILEKAHAWGYEQIETPTLEHLDLFQTKIGTEIVQSLYSFQDRSGRALVLVPELTAPTMRLVLSQMTHRQLPLRLCYLNSCYRYENPQSGRYRQFTQFGIEILTPRDVVSLEPIIDCLLLAHDIFQSLNLSITYRIGDVRLIRKLLADQPKKIQEEIFYALDKRQEKLFDELCLKYDLTKRFEKLIGQTEKNGDLDELTSLIEKLKLQGLNVELDLHVIRGLDYYSGIVFEAFDQAGNQLMGGGEYCLFEEEQKKKNLMIRSFGFGIGFDRLLNAIAEPSLLEQEEKSVYVRVKDLSTHFIELIKLHKAGIKIIPIYQKEDGSMLIARDRFVLSYENLYWFIEHGTKRSRYPSIEDVISSFTA